MFVMDMPDLPPQYGQVMIAQAGAEKRSAAKIDRTLGVCQAFENRQLRSGKPKISAINSVSPISWVENYFQAREHRQIEGPSTVTVLENPQHGELKDEGTFEMSASTRVLTDTGKRGYSYIPAPGYVGKDRAIMLVEMAGMKIRIVFSFHVEKVLDDRAVNGLCPPPYVRKISLAPDTDLLSQFE